MIITNDGWTWGRAAQKAHDLSLCNPDKTLYAVEKPSGEYCITDNPMIATAAQDGSAHRNGERVGMPYHTDPAGDL